MKKHLLLLLFVLPCWGIAQETEIWRIGGQLGFQGNKSALIGGDRTADSRFEQKNAGAAGLNIYARYDYNQHWMLLTGLGISSYGFEFSFSQNYSLLNPESRRQVVKNDIGLIEIPFLIHYKFNPSCTQVRWVIGAGFIQNLQTEVKTGGTYVPGNESSLGLSYFTSEVQLGKSLFPTFRFTVGKEKMLKAGDILSIGMLFNYGFAYNAKTTVKYAVDGKSYVHQYGNNGNFVGLRAAYYFAPVKK